MALAIVLILIVDAVVIFHVLSPWWSTPLASNWGLIDDTLTITLWITGAVFILINLFVAYCVIRFRRETGAQAHYEPENRKLEYWLIGLTSVGVIAMLAPGLFVYADLVKPPKDALELEAVGQQWQWSFRLPGKDGQLGQTDIRFVSAANPYGMSASDPHGQDDVLVQGSEVHLPLGQPVKVLLRAKDVLHDFYVPQFRARMDMVPGMITSFWFTPTKTGNFELMCAELCGVGHYNMRGHVVIDEPEAYRAWLATQPTFAHPAVAAAGGDAAAQGKQLAQSQGCMACHSVDGSKSVGPTWKGLYGRTEHLSDGSSIKVDEAYLKQSIHDPKAKVVQGYPPIMPQTPLTEAQVSALVAYIKAGP